MAWERRRRNRRYYYRSFRDGNRVRKVYFGAGPAAEDAAEADRQARLAKKSALSESRQRARTSAGIQAAMAQYLERSDEAIRSLFDSAGLHQHHRGTWRKRK